MTRRRMLRLGGAAAGLTLASGADAWPKRRRAGSDPPLAAIAFDAFAVFDPRPIAVACEREFPGHGTALMTLWRTRQFEYQWLRALGRQYTDFRETTAAALDFACAMLNLPASAAQRAALLQEYLELRAWPDVSGVLARLKRRGLALAILSNATPAILAAGIRNSGLDGVFDHVISTDRARTFKPDPRAYQLGVEVLEYPRERILFVAFAGWDVAGAKWFGHRTFWNNRLEAPAEGLDASADAQGTTLEELERYVGE